jgi:hypothetical protein
VRFPNRAKVNRCRPRPHRQPPSLRRLEHIDRPPFNNACTPPSTYACMHASLHACINAHFAHAGGLSRGQARVIHWQSTHFAHARPPARNAVQGAGSSHSLAVYTSSMSCFFASRPELTCRARHVTGARRPEIFAIFRMSHMSVCLSDGALSDNDPEHVALGATLIIGYNSAALNESFLLRFQSDHQRNSSQQTDFAC